MKLVKLYGLQNVLLLAFGMSAFKYGFLDKQANVALALNHWQYTLMVLACMLIAAGGAFINNVAGMGKENTTQYSEATAYNIYIALTLAGVGLGYYIANFTGRPMFCSMFSIQALSSTFTEFTHSSSGVEDRQARSGMASGPAG